MGEPRLLRGRFAVLMGATLAYFVSFGALLPTLPVYVQHVLGGREAAVGLVVGAFSVTALVVRPWAGRLSDVRGRHVGMAAGAAVAAAAVAGLIAQPSLAVVVALRMLAGVGEGLFFVAAMAAAGDLAPPHRRGEAMSLFSLALYGGVAAGPALGELVLNRWGFAAVWVVSSAAAVGAVAGGSTVRTSAPAAARTGLVHRAALLPGAVFFSSIVATGVFNALMPLKSRAIGLGGSKLAFAVFALVIIAVRSAGATIPDRVGAVRSAGWAQVLAAAGLVGIAVAGDGATLLASTVVFSAGQALAFPALTALAASRAPASERGAVLGTFTMFIDLGFGVGALAMGALAQSAGLQAAFLATAALAVAGRIGLVALGHRTAAVSAVPA